MKEGCKSAGSDGLELPEGDQIIKEAVEEDMTGKEILGLEEEHKENDENVKGV